MNIHRIKINNISLDRYESELLDELLYVFIARLGAVLEPKYDIVLKHCDTFFRHCMSELGGFIVCMFICDQTNIFKFR